MVSYLCFYSNACAALFIGNNTWKLMLMMPPLLTPHYSIELRSYFTNFYNTVVAYLGATEALCIQMVLMIIYAFHPSTNEFGLTVLIEISGYPITISDLVILFSFLSGTNYNITNIYEAFKGT